MPLPLGVVFPLCIAPAFALRFLDLLGLWSTPTTHVHSTVRATVSCPWTLEHASCSFGTFPASRVCTQAVLRRSVFFHVPIRFVLGHRARSCKFRFDCHGHDCSYLMNRGFRSQVQRRRFKRRSLEDRARGPRRDFCFCNPLFLSELQGGFRHICDHNELSPCIVAGAQRVPSFGL